MKKKFILCLLFTLSLVSIEAKRNKNFEFSPELEQSETEIAALFDSLHYATLYGSPDSIRIGISDAIYKKMDEVLRSERYTFYYPFEKLTRMGKVYSDDYNLRIFSWNCELSDLTQRYYGFFQTDRVVYPLQQKKGTYFPSQRDQVTLDNWYGTHYYTAIEWDDDVYLLLGVGKLNVYESVRVIDVLTIVDDKRAVLGAPIFHLDNGENMRMAFRYCTDIRMVMEFKPNGKRFTFDRLAPSGTNMPCLAPDMSFDSLRKKGKRFIMRKDVDMRNKKEKTRTNKMGVEVD